MTEKVQADLKEAGAAAQKTPDEVAKAAKDAAAAVSKSVETATKK
jgi:formiminotetrahydrofolate cyclodeaminase